MELNVLLQAPKRWQSVHAFWEGATCKSELRQVQTASFAFLDVQDTAAKATADPLSYQLQQKAQEDNKLSATAQCASSILATFPNPSRCVTNAVHIFSESTITDLGNDKKVKCFT
jgi:hypothetical protein